MTPIMAPLANVTVSCGNDQRCGAPHGHLEGPALMLDPMGRFKEAVTSQSLTHVQCSDDIGESL